MPSSRFSLAACLPTDEAQSRGLEELRLATRRTHEEYLAYSRRSAREVQAHGGRVIALGKFRASADGSIEPRSVLILVEWESQEAFDAYCSDPRLADLHSRRINGTRNYIWHLFDKLDDLRPILK